MPAAPPLFVLLPCCFFGFSWRHSGVNSVSRLVLLFAHTMVPLSLRIVVILGDLLRRKIYSCAFVGLSVTLSGIGFGFGHIMSDLSHQPSACNAKATRHGMPTRSFGFKPIISFWWFIWYYQRSFTLSFFFPASFRLAPTIPCLQRNYRPRLSQQFPSFRSTRLTSRNTSTILATYSSGVGSNPSCPSTP
jgi:hypothetical protein